MEEGKPPDAGDRIAFNGIGDHQFTRGCSITIGDGNRVEGNTIWGTTGEGATYGIRTVSTTDNLILKNSCVENGTNYELDSDDTFGPIVDAAGELGTADGASHPWANFSR